MYQLILLTSERAKCYQVSTSFNYLFKKNKNYLTFFKTGSLLQFYCICVFSHHIPNTQPVTTKVLIVHNIQSVNIIRGHYNNFNRLKPGLFHLYFYHLCLKEIMNFPFEEHFTSIIYLSSTSALLLAVSLLCTHQHWIRSVPQSLSCMRDREVGMFVGGRYSAATCYHFQGTACHTGELSTPL